MRLCFLAQLGVGQVIKGWDEGVIQMSKGERANLTCTPDYAYVPAPIPPPDPSWAYCFMAGAVHGRP